MLVGSGAPPVRHDELKRPAVPKFKPRRRTGQPMRDAMLNVASIATGHFDRT